MNRAVRPLALRPRRTGAGADVVAFGPLAAHASAGDTAGGTAGAAAGAYDGSATAGVVGPTAGLIARTDGANLGTSVPVLA